MLKNTIQSLDLNNKQFNLNEMHKIVVNELFNPR